MAQKGFTKVAPSLLMADPWLPPQKYAERALAMGLCGSDAKDPVFSLPTTLMRQVRDGRMPGIKAVKIGGRLCYGPANSTPPGSQVALPVKESPVTILLPPDIAEKANLLVELGKFGSLGEAVIWLAREGIKAKQPELQSAEITLRTITLLRQKVSI